MQRVPSKGAPVKNRTGTNTEISFGADHAGNGAAKLTKSEGFFSEGGNTDARDSGGTPLLMLARRIREEQGVEQLKEFLSAMTPFVAPGELKMTGERFGISYSSLNKDAMQSLRGASGGMSSETEKRSSAQNESGAYGAQQNMPSQLQMLQKLMLLQNVFGGSGGQNKTGGADPAALLRALSSF